MFCNLKALFKTLVEARDPFLDNVAALIATSWGLEQTRGITDEQIMAWESDQRNSEPYAALRSLTAFARSYSAFRVITHETVAETLERQDLQMQTGNKLPKIHGLA